MTGERDGTRPATRHGKVAPVAGVALLTLAIVLVAGGAVLFLGRGDFGRIVWGLPGVPGLWALGFSVAGYPISRRHPANPVGWLLMVAGVAAGVLLLGFGLGGSDIAFRSGPMLWLANAWVVSVGALSSAVVLFPSGSPPSRRWWLQLVLLWGSGALVYLECSLPEWLNIIAAPVAAIFQLSLAAGFFSLLVRWRRSGSTERLQLKWVVYGAALVAVTAMIVEMGIANLAPTWYLPGTAVLSIVILAVPVAMGVAMLRYRLYDIDIVINRTIVYGLHTSSLVLVYVGSVVSLQVIFRTLTGQETQLAVVASTLAIAAMFNPLRHRIQKFIDRRFYRRKYDVARTLEGFSAKLRDETDLDRLGDELVGVVRETMQPGHVSLWLRPTADLSQSMPGEQDR